MTKLKTFPIKDIDIMDEILEKFELRGHEAFDFKLLTGIQPVYHVDETQDRLIQHTSFIESSDTLQLSADTAITGIIDASYTKYKEFQIAKTGTCKVTWEVRSGVGTEGKTKIYKNGSAYSAQAGSTTTYATKTVDNIPVTTGDLIQLYAYRDGGAGDCRIKNYRLYCDEVDSNIGAVILDS